LAARQKAILGRCTLLMLIDGFDTQVIGFAAHALLANWKVERPELAPILGTGLLGMALGAGLGGYVGDMLGRRVGMIASTVAFGLAVSRDARRRSPENNPSIASRVGRFGKS